MTTIVLEDFTSDDKIAAHANENSLTGVSVTHSESKFKTGLLEVSMTSTRKSLLQKIELSSLTRPASMCSGTSQLESFIAPFSVVLPYINEMSKSDDYVYRVKLLTGAMCAFMGELLLRMESKVPVVPRLGETLQAKYANNAQIYFEQISSVPNICYVLLTDDQFKLYGKIQVAL